VLPKHTYIFTETEALVGKRGSNLEQNAARGARNVSFHINLYIA